MQFMNRFRASSRVGLRPRRASVHSGRKARFVSTERPVRLVAIHQPNFFPWLGYFDKISRADVFVILDNVQFQKTGGTWSNRVMLNVGGQGRWVTAPVVRSFHGVKRIDEVEFNESTPWRVQLLKTIETNYRRARFFEEVFAWLRPLIVNETRHLCTYNMAAIRTIAAALGLSVAKLTKASDLPADGRATELLAGLVKAVGGTHYLAGGGAQGYQQDTLFERAGLGLVYQYFQHPVYLQPGRREFVPGLSVIDALMNCGAPGTRALLGSEGW